MPERLQENNHLLEQAALRALKHRKVKPDPQLLYSLQLMKDVLDRKQSDLPRWSLPDVRTMVEQLQASPPNHAQDYLLQNPESGDPTFLPSELKKLKQLSPVDLANLLLQHLSLNLNADLPGHPNVSPYPTPPRQTA